MTAEDRTFGLALLWLSACCLTAGYCYGTRQLRETQTRRDSLRVELTQLEERYRVALVTDTLRQQAVAEATARAERLQAALGRTISTGQASVDTLRVLVSDTAAQRHVAILDAALLDISHIADSLIGELNRRDSLRVEQRRAYDSLLTAYRRLSQAAVSVPAPKRNNGLRLFATGALAGALLWEVVR